jgi:hypothetical protein
METLLAYIEKRIVHLSQAFVYMFGNNPVNPLIKEAEDKWKRHTPFFEEFDMATRISYNGMSLSPSSLIQRFRREFESASPFAMYRFIRCDRQMNDAYKKFIETQSERLYHPEGEGVLNREVVDSV